jgi:HK97 family phage major capsid protein
VLAGKPVYFGADVPAIGSSTNAVIYGDFRAGYQIVDRIGIRVLRDPYTTKGFILYYTTKRVGGGVVQFQAFKVLTCKS